MYWAYLVARSTHEQKQTRGLDNALASPCGTVYAYLYRRYGACAIG